MPDPRIATGISDERAWTAGLSRMSRVQLINERRRLERLHDYHANGGSEAIMAEAERLIAIVQHSLDQGENKVRKAA